MKLLPSHAIFVNIGIIHNGVYIVPNSLNHDNEDVEEGRRGEREESREKINRIM